MKKIILLAEDSEDDEWFFRRVMEQAGVKNPIAVVRNGQDAIAYLSGDGLFADRNKFPLPEIFFLDLKMAPIDGWHVLAWIKSRPELRNMIVVVLSQIDGLRQLHDAYGHGAKSFLVKPFKAGDVERLIAHFPDPWVFSSPGIDTPRL